MCIYTWQIIKGLFGHSILTIRSLNIYVEMIAPENHFLNHITTFRRLVTVQYILFGNQKLDIIAF